MSQPVPRSFVNIGRRALELLNRIPLYARVDGVETETGFRVLEVELVEPELFFRHSDAALDRFVGLLSERLDVD